MPHRTKPARVRSCLTATVVYLVSLQARTPSRSIVTKDPTKRFGYLKLNLTYLKAEEKRWNLAGVRVLKDIPLVVDTLGLLDGDVLVDLFQSVDIPE